MVGQHGDLYWLRISPTEPTIEVGADVLWADTSVPGSPVLKHRTILGAWEVFTTTGGVLPGVAYTHDQAVPMAVWTIDHNLGYRPGGVTVINTLGDMVFGEISHPTINQTVLTFSASFSGKVYLS